MSKNVWEWWTIMSNRVCTSGSMVVGTFAQACNLNSTSRNRITKSAEHRQPYQIPTTNPTYQFLDEFAVIVAKLGCRTLGRWWFVPYWQQISVYTPHTQKNTSFKFKSHQCILHWKSVYEICPTLIISVEVYRAWTWNGSVCDQSSCTNVFTGSKALQ